MSRDLLRDCLWGSDVQRSTGSDLIRDRLLGRDCETASFGDAGDDLQVAPPEIYMLN